MWQEKIISKLTKINIILILIEGVNGQLPNLDLINTIRVVAQHTANIPITLHDDIFVDDDNDPKLNYWHSLKHMLRTMKFQLTGHPSSNAGLYLRYVYFYYYVLFFCKKSFVRLICYFISQTDTKSMLSQFTVLVVQMIFILYLAFIESECK